jgi:cobalamin synthase
VIAALTLDQEAVVNVAGLFNGNSGALVTALASTITSAQLIRDRLLNTIIALDPEGAGADYSDGMADTLDGYTDEVANLTEALADDNLSAGGKAALQTALARSNATLAKINAAFGGGE